MAAVSNGYSEWFQGKIHSVEVKDFVTYDHVIFFPGPYLNIILGPNGTGKSTLVAAIVLGMGGAPKILSRSQNIQDYVKNGKECAQIEIHVYKDSRRKSKFKRTFTINGKNRYFIDNVEQSGKKYLECVAELNIQIDNLCQFMPQDRVQDFAKMNAQELLHNTQISVCSEECCDMFDQLKALRAQQKGDGNDLAIQVAKLHENEGKIASMREQVDNIKLKSKLTAQIDICTKKKAWMEFEELFIKFKEIEEDFKKGNENKKRFEDELAPLIQQSEASRVSKAKELCQKNIKMESEKSQKVSTELNQLNENNCKLIDQVVKAEGDLQFAKQTIEENKKELEMAIVKQKVLVEDVKRSAENAGSEVDRKTQINEIMKERTLFTEKIHKLSEQYRKTNRQWNEEINPRLNLLTTKIKHLENSKNVRLELLRVKFDQVYRAVIWFRENQNLFKGKVYEPMILMLNVKEGCAKYFENLIALRDLLAFTCEDKDDVEKLFHHLRLEQKLEVNIFKVKPVRSLEFTSPPMSNIARLGFTHFLVELVDGPLPLINHLCLTSRIHAIPLGTEETRSVVNRIPKNFTFFFTPNHRYQVISSRYSDARSTEVTEITGTNLLNVAIDSSALENFKMQRQEVMRNSDRCRNEQSDIENQIKAFETKINELDTQKREIEAKFYNVEKCKHNLQRQMKIIENLKTSVPDIDKETAKFNKKTEGIRKSLVELQRHKLEAIKKLASAELSVEYNRKKQRILLRANAELEYKIEEAKEKLNNAISLLNNIKSALEAAKEKCKTQQSIASKLTNNKKPSDARNFPYKKQFDELPDILSELIDHMNELEGQIQCVRDHNPEVLTQYENLVRDAERLKGAIEESKTNQLNLDAQMDSLFEKWYEIVMKVVSEINRNFSKFMMLMGFAGEVELIRAQERDYADYGIAIRVKYRNDGELQCLDRFVQSGGERAVAIAAYMLSLQHMSHVPFRCVDEINQGMDPTNERRIFDLLVKETAQPEKSQFFFITPKLLEDLPYNEYMSVSIIFNGRLAKNPSVFDQFNQPH